MAFLGWKRFLPRDIQKEQIRSQKSKEHEDVERAYDWIIDNVKDGFSPTLDEMCQGFARSALPYVRKVMLRAIKIHRTEGDILLYKKTRGPEGRFELTDERNRKFAKKKRDAVVASGIGLQITGQVIDHKAKGLGPIRLVEKAVIVKRAGKLKDKNLARKLELMRIV